MEETTAKNTIEGTILLSEALGNSEIILAFASEYGQKIEQKYIRILIEAKNLEQRKSWTEQKEIEFWEAYQHISKLIQPVTIDSLVASKETSINRRKWVFRLFKKERRKSLVKRTVFFYSTLTIIVMFAMLVLQIYSLKGTTLLNKIQSTNTVMKEKEKRMLQLVLITENNGNNRSANMERDMLETEVEELSLEIINTTELLDDWLKLSRFSEKEAPTTEEETEAEAEFPMDGPPEISNAHNNNIKILEETKNYTLILNMYILPLLYGLLGALVFVLRDLRDEIKTMVFSHESNISFALRTHLGALAGLVVGLFWGDLETQQLEFVESLSPLAAAFLAGYSVEYVFRWVESFLGSAENKITKITSSSKEE